MIKIAVKLIEPVRGGQHLVLVAEMVLAELPVAYPCAFSSSAMVGSPLRMPRSAPGNPTLLRPVRPLWPVMKAERPAVYLLAIIIGKDHPLFSDRIDVGGAISHQAVGVRADIGLPDIVAPNLPCWALWMSSVPRHRAASLCFDRRCYKRNTCFPMYGERVFQWAAGDRRTLFNAFAFVR